MVEIGRMTPNAAPSATPQLTRARDGLRALSGAALAVAACCALPMLAVLIAALSGGTETVQHLIDTVLGRYTVTTLLLVLLVRQGSERPGATEASAEAAAEAEAAWASTVKMVGEARASLAAWSTASAKLLARQGPGVVAVGTASELPSSGRTAAAVERALAASFFVAHRRAFEGDEQAVEQVRHIARVFPTTRTGHRASYFLASLDR